ncbi:hypothetical protein VNO77_33920 [Canavalia gladiata]|uniref:Ribosomal protein S13 n=1 Tax=Canavalia gladiata TaxID=3824 RepID=A0AAN9KE91_CANGL
MQLYSSLLALPHHKCGDCRKNKDSVIHLVMLFGHHQQGHSQFTTLKERTPELKNLTAVSLPRPRVSKTLLAICIFRSSNSNMFGSSRIVSDIALRLRQNLSLRGVRVQNINIGGGVGGEIPDNKRLEYALQHIHGIGRSKAHHIVSELGVENKHVKDLSKRELYSIRELLSKYLIGNDLKKSTEREVGRLVSIQCYRGIRHADNLPCRGQRTHTNARTRRSRRTFAGSR